MKTMNFASRKNQRRVEALERMKIDLRNTEQNIKDGKFVAELLQQAEGWVKRQKIWIKNLEDIIAKPFQTHTKKDRSGSAKLKGF